MEEPFQVSESNLSSGEDEEEIPVDVILKVNSVLSPKGPKETPRKAETQYKASKSTSRKKRNQGVDKRRSMGEGSDDQISKYLATESMLNLLSMTEQEQGGATSESSVDVDSVAESEDMGHVFDVELEGHKVKLSVEILTTLAWLYENPPGDYARQIDKLKWFHDFKDISGLRKNTNTSYQLYKVGAQAGNKKAMERFAHMLYNGIGCDINEELAITYYSKSSEQGYAPAQNMLGIFFETGKCGMERNPENAFHYYEKAGKQGYVLGMKNMAMCYYRGVGTKKDYEMALKYFGKAANAGNALSQSMYGYMLSNALGIQEPDFDEAFKWFQRAAEQNDHTALLSLGECYEFGKGCDRSIPKAKKHYERSARLGNATAMYNLGWLLENDGHSETDEGALFWHLQAAKRGNDSSMKNAAILYFEGRGGKKNVEEGMSLLRQAADKGNGKALYELGMVYHQGLDGACEKDDLKARIYLQMAAEQGIALARRQMGVFYQKGLGGLEVDFAAAAEWYRKGALQGEPHSAKNLGLLYQKGKGVDQSDDKAFRWYKVSAKAGLPGGLYSYAWMLFKGRGCLQSDELAYKNFFAAAELGNAAAMEKLGYFHEYGLGTLSVDKAKAFDWYVSAADAGDPDAAKRVGDVYRVGEGGVAVDLRKALRYYSMASEQKHPAAMYNLGLFFERGLGGVDADAKKAFTLFSRAAKKGNMSAILATAYCHYSGSGVKRSVQKGLSYYKTAANRGSAEAHAALGQIYDTGEGVEEDKEKAFFHYQQASEGEDPDAGAINNLGHMFQRGICCKKNEKKAAQLYLRAANLGHLVAAHNVGYCYSNGCGVPVNEELARQWYQVADGERKVTDIGEDNSKPQRRAKGSSRKGKKKTMRNAKKATKRKSMVMRRASKGDIVVLPLPPLNFKELK